MRLTKYSFQTAKTLSRLSRCCRLIRVFADHTFIRLVLSCCGSHTLDISFLFTNQIHVFIVPDLGHLFVQTFGSACLSYNNNIKVIFKLSSPPCIRIYKGVEVCPKESMSRISIKCNTFSISCIMRKF